MKKEIIRNDTVDFRNGDYNVQHESRNSSDSHDRNTNSTYRIQAMKGDDNRYGRRYVDDNEERISRSPRARSAGRKTPNRDRYRDEEVWDEDGDEDEDEDEDWDEENDEEDDESDYKQYRNKEQNTRNRRAAMIIGRIHARTEPNNKEMREIKVRVALMPIFFMLLIPITMIDGV